MKKNVFVRFVLTLALGTIITTSALTPFADRKGVGELPDPEMAVIEYNINI